MNTGVPVALHVLLDRRAETVGGEAGERAGGKVAVLHAAAPPWPPMQRVRHRNPPGCSVFATAPGDAPSALVLVDVAQVKASRLSPDAHASRRARAGAAGTDVGPPRGSSRCARPWEVNLRPILPWQLDASIPGRVRLDAREVEGPSRASPASSGCFPSESIASHRSVWVLRDFEFQGTLFRTGVQLPVTASSWSSPPCIPSTWS